MIQLAEQAQGSIELAEYQEVSSIDSIPNDNEDEDIQENDALSFEGAQKLIQFAEQAQGLIQLA